MFNDNTGLVVVTGVSLVLLAIFRQLHGRRLPPGPPGLPLLGNLLQIPAQHLSTYFKRVMDEYGSLVSLNVAGNTLILVGDMKTGKQLLEKQAATHSARPVYHYFRTHVDPSHEYWALHPESESSDLARKLTMGVMSLVRAGKTEPLQEFEALINIQLLLDDGGKDWFEHMNRFAASVVLTATFGTHYPTGREPELVKFIDVLNELVVLVAPTASITNVLPFLDWIPGPMPWRTRAQKFHKEHDEMYESLVEHALTGKGSRMNTWAAAFANKDRPEGDQSHLIRQFAAAAIETSAVSLHTFTLACIIHPNWIPAAQQEIDNVVGIDRLPSFKDRPLLPVVDAIVRETLRWRPALRSGIPHRATADDIVEHKGQEYFIPRGSIIFPVAWAIEHDKTRFEDNDRFSPRHFLDEEGKLKPNYETSAFGFGRRLCPGIPFAERSLWITIATMLWLFNIRRSEELDPKTNLPFQYEDSDAAFRGDFTNGPLKFPAVFEPRSLQRVEVARREWVECEKDLNILLPVPKSQA